MTVPTPSSRTIKRATARLLAPLAAIEWAAGLTGRERPSGRDVTIMFTDIEGFTDYAARRGNLAAVELLRRHDAAVLPALKDNRGEIIKRLGDGLMVSFPSPAHAVRAGLAMQTAARRRRVSLRVGVHTGEVLKRAGDLVGHDMNVASRVADRSRGGQVLVSGAVRSASEAESLGVWRSVGALRIGGTRPVRLHEVRAPDGRRFPPRRAPAEGPAARPRQAREPRRRSGPPRSA